MGMRLLNDVDFSNPHSALQHVCGMVDDLHYQLVSTEAVVTSGRRSPKAGSLHSVPAGFSFRAVDFRRWLLDAKPWYALSAAGRRDETSTWEFLRRARRSWWAKRYGVQFVLEPEELTSEQVESRGGLINIGPHIHMELDPNSGGELEWERIA